MARLSVAPANREGVVLSLNPQSMEAVLFTTVFCLDLNKDNLWKESVCETLGRLSGGIGSPNYLGSAACCNSDKLSKAIAVPA
jgi:hypothetical protein